MIAVLLAALLLAQTPTATVNDVVRWDYNDVDITDADIRLFLVCVDKQPTASCSQVPISVGVVSTPGAKTYDWKIPALVPGPHSVSVQACTLNAADCSAGASLAFTMKVIIVNPTNLRLAKSGG